MSANLQSMTVTDPISHLEKWLNDLNLPSVERKHLKNTCDLVTLLASDTKEENCPSTLSMGMAIADILITLNMDIEAVCAAILAIAMEQLDLTLKDLQNQTTPAIFKLLQGIEKINAVNILSTTNKQQIDNIRKMLLAIVQDVRVVVIKLADQLVKMRSVKHQNNIIKSKMAKETMNVFAPLANRLGLHQIKWELEDLAFFYLEKDQYLAIAKKLAETKQERDKRIERILSELKALIDPTGIHAKIHGRAKHIYSIKRKMSRKNVDFEEIYDTHAVRILVDNLEECYTVLSLVHSKWQNIPSEFDDYVANPKPNGYKSIHTALIDETGKHFEVQIRTQKMHEESEMGVAAHWKYKEGAQKQSAYEEKINWLRQLLDWQKELVHGENVPETLEKNIFQDRIYVFTPNGDILDLPQGATPLDFAYHIHTQVGHRCRGAKVNDKMVPLTFELSMGDRIEILTDKKPKPSRDWIVPARGYLKTSAARAKVLQFFKQQEHERLAIEGKQQLDAELQKYGSTKFQAKPICNQFHAKTLDHLYVSIANGTTKLTQLVNTILEQQHKKQPIEERPAFSEETQQTINEPIKTSSHKGTVSAAGASNLLTHIAKCCKPIPGDPIMGFITRGRGISIHHANCQNIAKAQNEEPERLIDLQWEGQENKTYPVDITVSAYNRNGLIRDITNYFVNQKITLLGLTTRLNKDRMSAAIDLTIETENLAKLDKIIAQLKQIPDVFFAGKK